MGSGSMTDASKRHTNRRDVLAASSTAIGFSLAGCTGSIQGEEPIKIGASVSQSGPYAKTADFTLKAYKLWVEEMNDNGGLLGRDVELVVYDDKSEPQQAIPLYRKLINEDNVDLLFGPYGSPIAKACAPIIEQSGKTAIFPMAADASIWAENDYQYCFQAIGRTELYLTGSVELAAQNDVETVGLAHLDEGGRNATGDGVVEAAEEAGIEITKRIKFSRDTQNFDQIASELANTNPDAIMGGGDFPQTVNLVRAIKGVGYNADLYSFMIAVGSQDFHDTLGSDANGIMGNSAWSPDAITEGNKDFVQNYKEKWDKESDYHGAGGYAGGQVLQKAVEQVGELDYEAIAKTLRENTFKSVFGTFEVDEKGLQVGYEHFQLQWQDGELGIVYPSDAATSEMIYPVPAWDEKK